MLDVTTTITVNGAEGDRFLSSLVRYHAPVPNALRWLATSDRRCIQVDRDDAERVARFVDDLLASGWIDIEAPPLLFSPRVGDEILVRLEVLAEVGRAAVGAMQTWRYLAAGTRGKLLGWRDRPDEDTRAVIDIAGTERRLVVYLRERHVTRAPAR